MKIFCFNSQKQSIFVILFRIDTLVENTGPFFYSTQGHGKGYPENLRLLEIFHEITNEEFLAKT